MSKLVLVEWVKSYWTDGWTTDSPPDSEIVVRSVGWLVHDGESVKTIASHMTDEDFPKRGGQLTIPSGCINSITVLTGTYIK